jgi:hypothetical protein
VFSLFYWLLDSGGPLARYHGERPYPDFAFTQQMSPEIAPPGWRPQYVDYLILGLTTSTAFSPTDVMPMAWWAKLTMALQSLISLTVGRARDRARGQRLRLMESLGRRQHMVELFSTILLAVAAGSRRRGAPTSPRQWRGEQAWNTEQGDGGTHRVVRGDHSGRPADRGRHRHVRPSGPMRTLTGRR